MAISDAQRERVARFQAQREQYLAVRAREHRESSGGMRMESKARLLGHAMHPMLIVFPLGLFATAAIFDVLHLIGGNGTWAEVSFYMMTAGIIGGLIAAVPGAIDWTAIPSGTRAKAIGLWHGVGNVVVIALFAASWALRRGDIGNPSTMAMMLSFAGISLALLTGWLGGELVDRLGVGVDRGAHLNSPNSLSGSPASASVSDIDTGEPQRVARA